MTTKNLADNSPLVQAALAEMQAIEERAAIVAQEAEELEQKRQETESQRDKALRALEISARRVRQQAQDNLVELDEQQDVLREEADQLVYILDGDSDDEPVVHTAPPAPEPPVVLVAPASEPEPEPAPPVTPEPLAPVEEEPEPTARMQVVIDRANPRNWGWISWVLAFLFAYIAYRVGDSFYDGNDNDIKQALLWLALKPAITLVGFFGGGLIGTFIQARLDRRRTTVVA